MSNDDKKKKEQLTNLGFFALGYASTKWIIDFIFSLFKPRNNKKK